MGWEPSKWHCSLLNYSPTYSTTTQKCGLPHSGEYPRLCPLLHNRCTETKKKKGPNVRTHRSSRKNTTKWWGDSQLIRCTVQNTGNQEAQRVPKKLDPRRNTPRHIIITLPKIKQERILEAAREKDTVTYKGVSIRLSADFSKETL